MTDTGNLDQQPMNSSRSRGPATIRRCGRIQLPNLCVARALALAASSSRFLGAAVDWSEARSRTETLVTSSTAEQNAASFTFEGLLKPLIFLTNCNDAARISSSVTGGSKLNNVLIFLHIRLDLDALKQVWSRRPTELRLSDDRSKTITPERLQRC